MRKKELKLIVTFYTTTMAMKMEKSCEEKKISGRLIPVPLDITSTCGMAWCSIVNERKIIEDTIKSFNIEIDSIYEIKL